MYDMGNRYNHNYVNNLYNSIKRHTIKKTQLICFTDDKTNMQEITLSHCLI